MRPSSASSTGLPHERKGFPAPDDLAARRAGLAAAKEAGFWKTDPPAEELTIAGIRALRFAPSQKSRGTLLHIHGGAFRIGAPEAVGPFAAALAERCAIEVLCPAYRLAPEYPFPAGLNDCWSVLEALASDDPKCLMLSGDSAGGAIATGLTALAIRHSIPLAALALLSPWLDLTVTNGSYAVNKDSDPLFSQAAAKEAATQYLQGASSQDPQASPSFADVNGFPPTFVNVGTGEALVGDTEQFFGKLQAAGISSIISRIADMDHVAATRDMALPGADQAFAALASFIDTAIAPD